MTKTTKALGMWKKALRTGPAEEKDTNEELAKAKKAEARATKKKLSAEQVAAIWRRAIRGEV
ncbi:hypothetical protein Rvan_2047 [Rhodomicrobium vannielii ATCC 17100]|uniref:Uncharacterized protein n=1 Tax=Rhodomicrobium vannielii (strain ATCC 17100 / DSM 162 / LMG 4299 / NCIMB 10020 / ATH 3.1.1) TaxID=648757 RepID=E3I1I4_RHOVT|nr:hypothetical protein [Rhodomicrobium vannielii]ADP71275.1 hypothetical protein Rvan_2047 [Rhodomicrobium vannielii ATCC 17100]